MSNSSIVACRDAGSICNLDNSRSQNAFALFYGGNFIGWFSQKQKVVSRSSTKDEYRALSMINTNY